MSRVLPESARLAQQGKVSEGIATLLDEVERKGESYSVLSNLAALNLQCGNI